MFLAKLSLPRRTFLKGVGASLALPLLDAMVPAATALASTPGAPIRRFGMLYVPHGFVNAQWTPSTAGTGFDFPLILRPFEPFRDQMVVITNLSNSGGGHSSAPSMFGSGISAIKKTEGVDLEAGTTIDQILAGPYRQDAPLASLEMAIEDFSVAVGQCDPGISCAYINTISWKTPTAPLPMEINPRQVFERLFGEGGTSEQIAVRLRRRRSVLDVVAQQTTRLRGALGPGDQRRLGDYLEHIREIEQRIEKSEQQRTSGEAAGEAPIGVPDSYDAHANLMLDLAVLAFQADVTRVFSFMMAREYSQLVFPNTGVSDPHHALSHHQNEPAKLARWAKLNTYFSQVVARFAQRLRDTPEGDGTLLDHSLVMYGSGMSEGNTHSMQELPIMLLGGDSGRLKGGRHLVQPGATPMSNLLLSLGQRAGAETDSFRNSTGVVDL